jgi:hypothetical protein
MRRGGIEEVWTEERRERERRSGRCKEMVI